MLKYLVAFVLFLGMSINGMNGQTSSQDLKGTWKAWDNLLLIYENDSGKLEGIYVDENGKQTQKERVLKNLKYRSGIWEADLYSKKRNSRRGIELRLKSPTKLRVKVKITSFFSKSFIWEKVKE